MSALRGQLCRPAPHHSGRFLPQCASRSAYDRHGRGTYAHRVVSTSPAVGRRHRRSQGTQTSRVNARRFGSCVCPCPTPAPDVNGFGISLKIRRRLQMPYQPVSVPNSGQKRPGRAKGYTDRDRCAVIPGQTIVKAAVRDIACQITTLIRDKS